MEQEIADLRARLEQVEYLAKENRAQNGGVDATVLHELEVSRAAVAELKKELMKRDNRIIHLLRALDKYDPDVKAK
jgi:hypothetical protein